MNVSETIGFIYLVFYFVLAGQAVFYLFCFTRVFLMIEPSRFISIRKMAAPLLDHKLRFWYYGCLLSGGCYLIVGVGKMTTTGMVLTIMTYLLLLLDVSLASLYNIPLNKRIDEINPEKMSEAELGLLRNTWLKWIDVRGKLLMAGFIILLAVASFFDRT
jgi:hypothetical protein